MNNMRIVTTAGIYMVEKVEDLEVVIKQLNEQAFITARPVAGGISRKVSFTPAHVVAIEVLDA